LDKNIAILDAGCGTGGLLSFLRQKGYSNLVGFDGSADAVDFCRQRGLNVTQHNLLDIADYQPHTMFDVIVCDDVLCYLSDDQIRNVLEHFRKWLKPNGVFISNNNAFDAFYGTHDIAVGSKRRFVKSEVHRFVRLSKFTTTSSGYWSFLLSPLILAVRQWQSFKLRHGWEKPENVISDVALPPRLINETLYQLVTFEGLLLPQAPFGSSLFSVMRPC